MYRRDDKQRQRKTDQPTTNTRTYSKGTTRTITTITILVPRGAPASAGRAGRLLAARRPGVGKAHRPAVRGCYFFGFCRVFVRLFVLLCGGFLGVPFCLWHPRVFAWWPNTPDVTSAIRKQGDQGPGGVVAVGDGNAQGMRKNFKWVVSPDRSYVITIHAHTPQNTPTIAAQAPPHRGVPPHGHGRAGGGPDAGVPPPVRASERSLAL